MDDEIMVERIAALAAAARIPLEERSSRRIANAIRGTLARLHTGEFELPLEVEPSSFVVAQQTEADA
jgi:hypothetical protein